MATKLTDKDKKEIKEKIADGKKETEPKKVTAKGNQSSVSSGFSVPERIWNFLCNEKSLGSITAASIMGNIAQESMYNTSAVSSDGQGSIGICQWTNPDNGPVGRKTNLINFAKSIGKDPGDLEAQLQFLWKECEEGGYIKPMRDASASKSSVEDKIAAEVESFCFGFERPNRAYANLPNRIKYALEAYNKQGKGILSAGTYVPSNTPGAAFMGQASAAKRGVIVEKPGTEKEGHVDEYLVKPDDPDKTFCEPIYPDLTSIGEDIPAYAVPDIPTSEMNLVDYKTAGAGLVYSLPTSNMVSKVDDKDILQFTLRNEEIANQRKQLFEKSKCRNAIKVPSAGKPPNNKDPFPVDHKIVELETHQPRCKIESVKACHHSLEVAKALVLLSTDTEKRLVRIENNMATMMRYLYRMASRVNINCVYYGGQVPANYPETKEIHNKYCCIRCLKDDRIQEGKQVSLDQCLNCTRYEPLIGQIYDIFNDSGENLSVILDNNQMSYTTMDEYYKFRNLDERQKPMESAKSLESASVQTRNISEIDFDDEWGPGLAMDWSLYPVELQRPHTNPPVEGALASSYGANSGMALTNGGVQANMLIEARNQIDASESSAKQKGSEFATTNTDTVVAEVKALLGSKIRDYYKEKNITSGQDSCLIAALMKVYGGDVGHTVDTYENVKKDLTGKGVDNIVLHVMFYSLDQKYLLGDGKKDKLPVRLDEVSQKGMSETDNNALSTIMPEGSWNNIAKWNWNDISIALTANIKYEGKDNGSFELPKDIPEPMINFAKVVYLYKELIGKCSASRFDTAEFGFPFTEEQITSNLALNFSSGFKWRWGRQHWGIDIGVGSGADSYKDGGNDSQIKAVPIHAARDGIVYDIATFADNNGGGQQVYLQHDGGYTSWYMHLSGFAVKKGDRVNRGDIIGYTGGSGAGNSMLAYPEHLHFEIHQGGDAADMSCRKDPLIFYNGITMANEGSQLSAINV